ncbi:MAG: hypothetical protein WD512_12305 [Candidatus Paceibacterota bacterium]
MMSIINPYSGRKIMIGGGTYNKLQKLGLLSSRQFGENEIYDRQKGGGIDDLPVYLRDAVIKKKENQIIEGITAFEVFLLENGYTYYDNFTNYYRVPPSITLINAWHNLDDEGKQYYKDLAITGNNML